MTLNEKLKKVNEELNFLFYENTCKNISYFCVVYNNSGRVSCIFKCDGGKSRVKGWMTNNGSPQSYAYWWKSGRVNTFIYSYKCDNRTLYEIDQATYLVFKEQAIEKKYSYDSSTKDYLFEIYFNEYIYQYDNSKDDKAQNSIVTPITKKMIKI